MISNTDVFFSSSVRLIITLILLSVQPYYCSSVLLNEGRPTPGLPDRSLYSRNLPELFGYSGSLYQAYMPPLLPVKFVRY